MRGLNRILAGFAALALGANAVNAEVVTRVCILTPDQEPGTIVSNGIGCGRFVIDTDANTLTYRIVVGNLSSSELFAHIHGSADPGVNAGVLHTLPNGPVKVGTWNYLESQEPDILNGKMYVNVHTSNNGGGEVRGQIVTHVAYLDGAGESPAVATAARGFALFNMNRGANTMSYYIKFSGLGSSEVDTHIHGPAVYGFTGAVAEHLAVGSPKVGVWNYPPSAEQDIVDGLYYLNVETLANPTGEIRGSIVATVAPTDPTQEPVAATSIGLGLVAIDRVNNRLAYDFNRTALGSSEILNHIHGFAPAGTSAGVQHTLPSVGLPRKIGVWNYSEASEANILNGLTYFNCHSSTFGGGEIRGQILFPILPEPPVICAADLDNDGVFPGGTSDGGVDISDLLYFLAGFEAGSPAVDLDNDGDPAVGTPDGGTDISDLLFFLARFESGC